MSSMGTCHLVSSLMSPHRSLTSPTHALCLQTKLDFTAPENPGDYTLVLYLMSDSYLGCDQEYEIPLTVLPDEGGDEDESEED